MCNYIEGNVVNGFDRRGYDLDAIYPDDSNWVRLSQFNFPSFKNEYCITSFGGLMVTKRNNACADFVIDKDENIIIPVCDQHLLPPHYGVIYKVDLSGSKTELFRYNEQLDGIVIGKNEKYYFTSINSDNRKEKIFCLNTQGALLWSFELPNIVFRKPVLDQEGNCYICTSDEHVPKSCVFCFDTNGRVKWEKTYNSSLWCEPAISKGGCIFIGLNSSEILICIDSNGNEIWTKRIGFGINTLSIILSKNGTIYAFASDKLFAINQNGELIWEYRENKPYSVITSPAMDSSGNLYFSVTPYKLVSLTPCGKVRWKSDIHNNNCIPPIVDNNGNILQVNYDWIDIFSNDGKQVFSKKIDGLASLILSRSGLIYLSLKQVAEDVNSTRTPEEKEMDYFDKRYENMSLNIIQ